MESHDDEARIFAMLLQFRDSLTEMSLLLKDYQANLDVLRQGPTTMTSCQYVESIRRSVHFKSDEELAPLAKSNQHNRNY